MKAKKSLAKALSALALSAALCVGSIAPAFAAPTQGTAANPAEAYITKVLQMGDGVTTPDATASGDGAFEFTVTPNNKDGVAYTTGSMPTMAANMTIGINSSDTADTTTTPGTKVITKESANILAGLTFTSGGVYTYEIAEVSGTYTDPGNTNVTETMTYSAEKYQLKVYVQDDGTNVFPEYVELYKTVADDGTAIGTPAKDPTGPEAGDHGMAFTNTFVKKSDGGSGTPGGPGTTDPALFAAQISKVVTGQYASTDTYFDFTLNVTAPVGVATGTTYSAYVKNTTTGAVAADVTPNMGTGAVAGPGDAYIVVTPGTPLNFKLKANETLLLSDINAGASYSVNELAVAEYQAGAQVVVGGAAPIALTTSAANEALSTGARTISDAGANSAAYTNTRAAVTPTGVIINNLPFILTLVLVGGAFAGYVVVKSRKRTA